MNTKPRWILVLAVFALSCLVGWSSRAQSSSKTTWEYKVVTIYGTNDIPPPNLNQFNQMGTEGWELVTIRSEEEVSRSGANHRRAEYYFKRVK